MLVVLDLLVTSFLGHVMQEVFYRNLQQPSADIELEWQSCQEVTLAVLKEFKDWDRGLFSPEQGWGDPMRFTAFPWSRDLERVIDIQDEAGKLPCRKGNSYEPLHQAWIAQYVRDWGAERKVQETWQALINDQPVALKKNPGEFGIEKENVLFKTLEALRPLDAFAGTFFHEKGWGNGIWAPFRAPLSTLSVGPININTARPELRKLLAQKEGGWDLGLLEAFFQQQDTFHMGNIERFFRNTGDFPQHGIPSGTSVKIHCGILHVAIALKQGEGDEVWQYLQKNFWVDPGRL